MMRTGDLSQLVLLVFIVLFLSSCYWVSAQNKSINNVSMSECSPSSCGTLNGVAYPFGWEDSNCGASPYFVLSNCTNGADSHPLWPGFNATYNHSNTQTQISPAPAVTGLYIQPDGRYNLVNLSWSKYIDPYTASDSSPDQNSKCKPLPVDKPSSYGFPSSIMLLYATASPDYFDHFEFSANTIILVFNCSNISAVRASNYLQSDNSYCNMYDNFCNGSINSSYNSCYQYGGRRELNLNGFIKLNYSCTHFQFFTVEDATLDVGDWAQHSLQLSWDNTDFPSSQFCNDCAQHNGSCGYSDDTNNLYNPKCFCSESSGDYCGQTNKSKNLKAIYGVIIAAAIMGLLLLLGLILYCRQRYYKQLQFDFMSHSACDNPIHLSYKSVVSKTGNFKDKVGEGGNGVVYRGIMKMQELDEAGINRDMDVAVAVKVLDPDSRHSTTQFVSEVSTICSVHHINVVKLLGFCTENAHRILIYEFASNGSLDKWLFRNSDDEKISVVNNIPALGWKQRHAIAVGVARGLCYLHEECRHQIVHCDIKPQNIVLDEQMNPKIADFGLAKFIARRGEGGCSSSVVTMAKGTPGYVAPEFWMGGESRLTTKFDVYSYGMVLLELISGRPNFTNGIQKRSTSFPVQAFEAARSEDFNNLLDSRLEGYLSMDDLEKLRTATLVALWCTQDSPAIRPSMREVVQFLEGSLDVPGGCPPPAIVTTNVLAVLPSFDMNSAYLSDQRNSAEEGILIPSGITSGR